jgi:hypothetical protein
VTREEEGSREYGIIINKNSETVCEHGFTVTRPTVRATKTPGPTPAPKPLGAKQGAAVSRLFPTFSLGETSAHTSTRRKLS